MDKNIRILQKKIESKIKEYDDKITFIENNATNNIGIKIKDLK